MADILVFSRNRSIAIEQIDEEAVRASCRLQDTLMDAYVEIMVKIPDLEIKSVNGKLYRSPKKEEIDIGETFKKVIGTRVGPGIKKIIKGFTGDSENEKQLAFMLEECCSGVILTFTKEQMKKAPKDILGEKDYFENSVRENPRLYKSCAALSPGSPLVENIEFD
ncbi:hypothetical protein ACFL9T_12180 [Thermodesulfobacteriota bacterium]